MSVVARSVSTDPPGVGRRDRYLDDLGGAGGARRPLTRQGVLMAANSRQRLERSGDREKSLKTALLQIERQFGPVEVIPTGSVRLDVAPGLGVLPRGRIVEIYGPESSRKTTLALHALANAQ